MGGQQLGDAIAIEVAVVRPGLGYAECFSLFADVVNSFAVADEGSYDGIDVCMAVVALRYPLERGLKSSAGSCACLLRVDSGHGLIP